MKNGMRNTLVTQITGLSGCAHKIRRTLNPPTITFSSQNSSRIAKTLQPRKNTPPSGTRFATTSTTALAGRRTARSWHERRGRRGARRSGAGSDRGRRNAGVPRDLQRAPQGVFRPAAAGRLDRQDRCAYRDGTRRRPRVGDRSRYATPVREHRRHGGGGWRVRDECPVPRREGGAGAARGGGPGGA